MSPSSRKHRGGYISPQSFRHDDLVPDGRLNTHTLGVNRHEELAHVAEPALVRLIANGFVHCSCRIPRKPGP